MVQDMHVRYHTPLTLFIEKRMVVELQQLLIKFCFLQSAFYVIVTQCVDSNSKHIMKKLRIEYAKE